MDRLNRTLLGEVRSTSQWKRTPTIIGMYCYWQEQGGIALNFNKQAKKEQLKRINRQLVMSFILQLHEPQKCLERICLQKWVLSDMLRSNPGISHQVLVLDEMNSVAGDALKNQRRSLCSEANAELQRLRRQSHEHFSEISARRSTPCVSSK